jgi:AraC-like DNA-binding protein
MGNRLREGLQLLSEEFQLPLRVSGHPALTSIAFELGYTDQSHFIKEFQEFAGMSPYNFVRNKSVGAESSSFLYI